jgi:hypothetical protein
MSGNARIRLRRDTAANWTTANPVLALGEPGYESDIKRLKVGDGTTAWADLSYTFPPNPRRAIVSGTTSGTQTPPSDTADIFIMEGLTDAITIAAPSGSPLQGQQILLRIRDNGTPRAITWTTSAGGYRPIGGALPVTTVASKMLYVGCIYNATDSFWDVVALSQEP